MTHVTWKRRSFRREDRSARGNAVFRSVGAELRLAASARHRKVRGVGQRTVTGGDVRKLFAMAALCVAVGAARPAVAQSVPEGQSCGGLLCDIGVLGHKTTPVPNGAAAAPPVAPRAEAAPAPVAAPEPVVAEARKRTVRKKKRIAKAAPASAPRVAAVSKPAAAAETAKPPASGATAVSDPLSQPRPAIFRFRPLY